MTDKRKPKPKPKQKPKTRVHRVATDSVDIDDQIVIMVDPGPSNPPNRRIFKTRDLAGTSVHFLWRPITDMPFAVGHTIVSYLDPMLHKDTSDQTLGTNGQIYHKLTAPFMHSEA